MKTRVFLDTNVFIYAFEFPESNSKKIIDLLNQTKIEVIISERVLKEVHSYFRKFYTKDMAAYFRHYLLLSCVVIFPFQVQEEIIKYKSKIKDKDLEQLAVTKGLGIKYLVAYDKDFKLFPEYITPRKFLAEFNIEAGETEF